ncbi:MAG: serine--tRNA ligase [bacterium]
MIDIKLLRENPAKVAEAMKARNLTVDLDAIIKLDEERRELMQKTEGAKAKKNEVSKKIPSATPEERKILIDSMKSLDTDTDIQMAKLAEIEAKFSGLMKTLPNIPQPDVKQGKDDSENEVLRTVGEPTKFDFKPKDHIELGEALGIIDVERAAKVSGARFGYLIGDGAMLEFALLQYTMQTVVPEGFSPVVPPVIIKSSSMEAMGFLKAGAEADIYHLQSDDSYLVGTSEQSIGPIYMDEILDGAKLPLRYAGFSTCFRRESGAAGKDTRGILRVHQFDKIEMFSFTKPEDSEAEHAKLLATQEKLVQGLGLPYHVLRQCTGDMGYPSARTYDIECWIPSQNKYRETHSTSNCTDYQARRLNTRYRDAEGKVQLVHTLNGTAFAIGRIIIAIMENFQQADGSILIPKVLQPFMFGKTTITKK